MNHLDIPKLKKGDLLFDTVKQLTFEVYAWPHEYKGEWRVDAYIYGKPRKNVNHIYILKHNCTNLIVTTNPDMAKILFCKGNTNVSRS